MNIKFAVFFFIALVGVGAWAHYDATNALTVQTKNFQAKR